MLSTVKSFDILPKHKGYGFISEYFALNLTAFNIKNCYCYRQILTLVLHQELMMY